MMKQKALTGALGALLLGISVPGFSAPSWDYLSLEILLDGNIDSGTSVDLEGYRVDAAKSLGDFVFARASSNSYDVDGNDVDPTLTDAALDFSTQQLSLGVHNPIPLGMMTMDIWASGNYERISLGGIIGTGPGIDVGVRALFTPVFEIGVSGKVLGDIDFDDLGDADYTGYSVTAGFALMPGFIVQGSYNMYELDFDQGSTIDYDEIIGLGVRLAF